MADRKLRSRLRKAEDQRRTLAAGFNRHLTTPSNDQLDRLVGEIRNWCCSAMRGAHCLNNMAGVADCARPWLTPAGFSLGVLGVSLQHHSDGFDQFHRFDRLRQMKLKSFLL